MSDKHPMPTVSGFYWSKWRLADQGDAQTAEYESYLPCDKWEIVEVVRNTADPSDAEHLRVSVCGVSDGQSLENFYWGPGPLEAPDAAPKRVIEKSPRDRFHNMLRVLLNIDQDEIGLDNAQWALFERDPFRWFIRASDADAGKVWAIVERRTARKP